MTNLLQESVALRSPPPLSLGSCFVHCPLSCSIFQGKKKAVAQFFSEEVLFDRALDALLMDGRKSKGGGRRSVCGSDDVLPPLNSPPPRTRSREVDSAAPKSWILDHCKSPAQKMFRGIRNGCLPMIRRLSEPSWS